MISVREEVRAKAQRCAEDAYNTAVAVQRGENVSESCTTIANQATDAIMSAFKRASGVVGHQALEAELVEDILSASDAEILSEAAEDGIDLAQNAADMRFIAKRITSAVEPSEMVDGLERAAALIDSQIEAYIKAHGMYDSTTGHMEYPGNGEEWVADREELAEAIRALKGTDPASAVEPHRHFVCDVANLSLSGEVTDEDEGTIFDPWPHDQHECLEKLIRRARDLIDGGAS